MTYHEPARWPTKSPRTATSGSGPLVEKDLGISTEDTTSPVKDAMVMGAAFIAGAAIPLVPHFFLTGGQAIGVSVGATLAGLFALGILKGRIVERSPLLQGLEILGIGSLSAAIGYASANSSPASSPERN